MRHFWDINWEVWIGLWFQSIKNTTNKCFLFYLQFFLEIHRVIYKLFIILYYHNVVITMITSFSIIYKIIIADYFWERPILSSQLNAKYYKLLFLKKRSTKLKKTFNGSVISKVKLSKVQHLGKFSTIQKSWMQK